MVLGVNLTSLSLSWKWSTTSFIYLTMILSLYWIMVFLFWEDIMEDILNWQYLPLVPPLLTLILVLATRKVVLSLGVGIIASAFVIASGDILETLGLIWEQLALIFVDGGAINTWNAYILIFLVLLGLMTAFISMSGGALEFSNWAIGKVKSRRQAKLLAGVLGIIIFIDDYFSALMTGQVSKPITDKYQVSRAKLAYIVDTTASPVSVIAPISSWGAGIMALIAPLLVTASIDTSAFIAFIQMIPMNLYVLASLALMFIVIVFNVNIGPMKAHEQLAEEENILFNRDKEIPGEMNDLPMQRSSTPNALIMPLITLALSVVLSMYITGALTGGSFGIVSAFEHTLVTHSLVIGGLLGLAVSLFYYFKYTKEDKNFGRNEIGIGIINGFRAMMPAIVILSLAWIIGGLIGNLGTGDVLGALVEESQMPIELLPAAVFIVACIMSLATGTSWGSFGILIPIAGEIVIALNQPDLLLITIAAVLAGSVFGDHCSPISDSTILASTGSGSNHIDHVVTQIPYAVIAAVIALVGFIVLGFTTSVLLGLLTITILLLFVIFIYKMFERLPRKVTVT